ncbi:dienelactone hydrolase [Rhizobium sp. BK529]|uniref:alpha/beta hydrolase n=1 Tax=unclassified Rhizobium TaxID=2613769 RepID=UPI00104C68A7|nr:MULTISPECIES: alpha/beta hydrolase [unclassified Rhizobium]MBB3595004.1 dienelactone hydrolase [Rhizobium sp. BK529]
MNWNEIIIGDIHYAPAPGQCLRQLTATQPVRRVDIRDLLIPSKCEEGIHQALVDGGYGFAASRLAQTYPQVAIGTGYSAGGTLLWKAVRLGMQVEALICIGSTRLRYEDPKNIQVPTLVVTGEHDPFAPSKDWATGTAVRHIVLRGCDHGFYIADKGRSAARFHIQEFLQSIGRLN